MLITYRRLGITLLALTAAACGGAENTDDPADTSSDELRNAKVSLEIRDDLNVYARGLRGTSGGAWDHFVKVGDRITLQNASSTSQFVVVEFQGSWTGGGFHKAQNPPPVRILERTLSARDGSFAWTVPTGAGAQGYHIHAYASASSQDRDHLRDLVSEPDEGKIYPVVLEVR